MSGRTKEINTSIKDAIVVWDYDCVNGKINFTDYEGKNHSVKALTGTNNLVCFKFKGTTYYLVPNDSNISDYMRNVKKPKYSAWRQIGNKIVACYNSNLSRKLEDTYVRDGFTGYYPTPEEYDKNPERWARRY